MSPHIKAASQALFVTFLWSTSWVLIKIGLEDIPALTFAGLRYSLAFLCLLPLVGRRVGWSPFRQLPRHIWGQLLLLGIIFYAVTQGAQFLGLVYLPAVTVSLLLNFTSVFVAVMGIAFLAEQPGFLQWVGMGLFLAGVLIYFYPVAFPASEVLGLTIVMVGVLANAGSAVLGRSINRNKAVNPLVVTVVSMGIGSLLLLVVGIATEGMPALNLTSWLIIGWLAVINTAFAFTLWNLTLQTLTAVESSIINNTMLIQIAVLAWIFLGEQLNGQEITGLVLVAVGVLFVQIRRTPRTAH
jgi:drug/metabolite transporter (DMT)-like permease